MKTGFLKKTIRHIFKGFGWVPVLLVALLVFGAVSCVAPETNSGQMVVAVSILPQSGFVKAVGGDRVEEVVMVPPGADPHTYEVTTDQMVQLS